MKRKAVAIVVEESCIGCTRCIEACPVDAIIGAQGRMHTVIEDWCIGCELCVAPCPVDCIDMVAPHGEWTRELKHAAGERGRRRQERHAASTVRSHGASERKAILAALLARK